MSAASAKINPFPGLRPFTQEEDYLFFGREEQTLELLQRLGSNRFVAVVGTSGSGKSSLVRCGLLSELLGGRMLEAGASWEIAVTHPGGNPLALLTESLLDADLYDREAEHSRENLLATLSRSHFGLVEAVKQAGLAAGTNFLLVVDQFEEIFRFHEAGQRQQEAANEFVSLLLEAAAQKEVPIYVVLTMRSDFIGECGQFEGLAEMVNRGEFLIPRLNRDQFKRVIEGPIKVAGGQIAPRLLQRLLNDLGQQADQLPCLQHALMRTWNVWAAKGDAEALDLDDYQRVGKMSQALSLHADEIFESLESDRQRELCQGMFQALTVEESNNRGIRRPQRLGRLCQILEVSPDELRPIIDAYRQRGVTFLMPSPEVELTEQTIVDISHESLMRVWTRLRQWVEEETQAAGIYHRLSESADLHAKGKAGLYRDPELGIALAWHESKRPNAAWAERYRPGFGRAIAFLETSQQASVAEEQVREAARQRELEQAQQLAEVQQLRLVQQQLAAGKLRKLIGGLAVVAVIAGVACVIALFANQRANRLAETAQQNEERAKENAQRAEQSKEETSKALAVVESQKSEIEGSLSKAEAAERQARAAEEAGRKLLYTTDLRLAPFVWRDVRTTGEQLRVLLAKHVPESQTDERPDLRGFEWHYYQHLFQRSAEVFSGHEATVSSAAFAADGQLVTLDHNGQMRRWDVELQDEDVTSRRDLTDGASAWLRALSPNGKLVALAEGDKVHVFDSATLIEQFQINLGKNNSRRLAFSGDSSWLVIVDDKIRWFTARGEAVASFDQRFDRIESLALSSDGLTLAVVGHSSTASMFSTYRLDTNAKKVNRLAKDIGRSGTLRASALSPDGQRLAFGAKLAGSLYVYNADTGRAISYNTSAHACPIAAMAFSADGTKLATGDEEGTINVWDNIQSLSSKPFSTLKGHLGAISAVRFSSDGQRLVTTSDDKSARVWDLDNTGVAKSRLELVSSGNTQVSQFSPDGLLIAVADYGGVRLWDATSGKIVRELAASGSGRVYSVAFSPTDRRLLAVGYGGAADVSHVVLWDIDTATELARLPGATDLPDFTMHETNAVVGALAFSPDGKYLAAGFGSKNMLMTPGPQSPLKVWDVAARRLIHRLSGHTGYCISLDFSRDGKMLASGSRDGTAIIWSTSTWKAAQTLKNQDQESVFGSSGLLAMVEGVAFSPDSKTLALASREGTVQLWDVASGQLVESLKGHSSAVNAIAFSPDGRTLASGGTDETIRLWNVETRRELMQLDQGDFDVGQVRSLAFSPDGRHLLADYVFWSAKPPLWNDADQAARELQLLLDSNADFQSRIRLLSENLRLHAALAKLDSQDPRVAAALAATQANWHASRHDWPKAAAAIDRLVAVDPASPDAWLRTPGLLRLATALLHEDRPRDAAALLTGGARRRDVDGLTTVTDKATLGFFYSYSGSQLVVIRLRPGAQAARSGLQVGDIIEKLNDDILTEETRREFSQLVLGQHGTTVRLTVRRPGSDQPKEIELTREQFVTDETAGKLLQSLQVALNERLASEPGHPGLLELRAEFAGQWSGTQAQVADYTAAIEALSNEKPEAAADDLKRLYGRRGIALVRLEKWPEAMADFAQAVTPQTTDEELLINQATAQANVILARESPAMWTVLQPTEMKSEGGATLELQPDGSVLASGTNPSRDVYSLLVKTDLEQITAIRLEALPDPSLPRNGPGRNPVDGNFHLNKFRLFSAGQSVALSDIIVVHQNMVGTSPTPFQTVIAGELDSNPGWGNYPRFGQANTATIATKLARGADDELKIEMHFSRSTWTQQNLGRFRLLVSSSPDAFDRDRRLFAAMKLSDPWQKLITAYRMQGDQQAIDQLLQRHPKLAGQIGDLFIEGADKDLARAVAIYSHGISAEKADAGLLSKRARAYEGLADWDAAAADWSRAAEGTPDGARLLAEFAGRLAAAGQAPLARSHLDRVQGIYERSLQTNPEDDRMAMELAHVLLTRHQAEHPHQHVDQKTASWIVLAPTEMKSQGGSRFDLQSDGTILVSGDQANLETYTIVAPAPAGVITSLRLEAIPHPSLPFKGSGRAKENGNSALAELNTEILPPQGAAPVPVVWKDAESDLETPAEKHYRGLHIHARNCIDGDPATYWETWPQSTRPHYVILRTAAPIATAAGSELRITLRFGVPIRHGLGNFRLSVSGDLAPVDEQGGQALADVKRTTDPWLKLAGAYALSGRTEEAAQQFGKALHRAESDETRREVLQIASRFDEVLSRLIQQSPDDVPLQLALVRNLTARGTVPELNRALDIYTRLHTSVPKWTVLTPLEMTTETGVKMELEKDGSVFVHQPPRNDIYTLVFQTELKGIKGVRLEALADPRLPSGGPGWNAEQGYAGNFVLSELSLEAAGSSTDQPASIGLRNPLADYSEKDWHVRGAADGNDGKGWGVHPQYNKDHVAVFETAKEIGSGQAMRLTVRLRHKYPFGKHLLGRFRLSFTNDAATLTATRVRLDLQDSELVNLYLALAKAHDKQGSRDKAVAALAQALALAADSAAKTRIIDEAAPLDGVLEKLAAHPAADGQFQAALKRYYSQQGNAALAEAARKRARALHEARLAKEPENSALAAELAELLLDLPRLEWTVLKPVEMSTNGAGAMLTPQSDDSVLASGENPPAQEYRLEFATELNTITAFRLEVLTDESLPRQGPGRGRTGNFGVGWNFTVSKAGDTSATPLRIKAAVADHAHRDHPINIGHWNIAGGEGKPHEAFLALETPLANDAGSELTLSIKGPTGGQWADESLGRFRLSATDDPQAFDHEHRRFAVIKLTDPWLKLAAAYAMNGDLEQAAQYFSAALSRTEGYEARKPIVELALRFADLLPVLAKRHAQDHQLQLPLARHLAARGQEALAAKKPADALAPLIEAQAIFARLLAPVPHWTTPTPDSMRSELGATMELQKDGSVFVKHIPPIKNDTYALEFRPNLQGISGLRLEVLPDSRLPRGASGWSGNGNFQLTEITLHAAPVESPNNVRTIPLRDAAADYSEVNSYTGNVDVRGAVDGNAGTGWAVFGKVDQPHTAVFRLAEEVDGRETRLTVRLVQRYRTTDHNIGRFRLSFTNDAGTLQATQIRLDLKDSELVDFYMALATAYAQSGRTSDGAQVIAQAVQQAPNSTVRSALVDQAIASDLLRPAILEHRADDHTLQLGYAVWLASQGRWDEAGSAYQHAAKLNAAATPPWLQTGVWTVGGYPYGLEQVFPPESNPDPLQPVAAAPVPGQSPPDALPWQPAALAANGRIDFGTARACNYALTRVFSPIEQEVAFQMGDDDRMRLFVNDRLLFQNTSVTGGGLPKEHELAVTLQAGWNTVLLKIENGSGACNAFLTLSRDPQDLADARVGSRVYQVQQLTAAGKADEALAQLTEMLAESPQHYRVVIARAEAYAKLSQWESALADWASADLCVPDNKQKYGTSPFYCLEQRAHIFNRLKQYDKALLEYNELLKPARHGNASWALMGRAGTYDRLRQWELARADYDQYVAIASASDKGSSYFSRARHLALQGLWKQASEDVLQAWQTPNNTTRDWSAWRDAALIHAIAGDMANYKKAASELFAQLSAGNPNADQCRWTLTVMTLFPDMITSENRPRLLEMVSKCDNYWRPRHTAMAALRAGDYAQAGEWLAANSNTAHLLFVRAGNEQVLGNKDLAKKLFEDGNAKLREQQSKDPGAAVPQPTSWQDWIPVVLSQYEASSLILGSAVGPPRKLALDGHTLRAADAYLDALKEAADQDSRSRIVDELGQFDQVVTILHERLPNDPSITDAYRQMVDRVAADYHKQLEALSPENTADVAARAKLIPAILAREGVLASLLKLRPEDTQLAALHAVRIGDWNNAASGYAKLTEENLKADNIAWMVPTTLWAYAGEPERHREVCQKMFERFRAWTTPNDAGRYLKVLLLLESAGEMPPDAVKKFTDSAKTYGPWYPSSLAFLQCRQGDYAEAHKQLDEALAAEAKSPSPTIKAFALATRALTWAKQQDSARARDSLTELKQVMTNDLKMKWNADGSLDGSTILNGATVVQDKLIPEILRREAEQRIQPASKIESSTK